MSAQRRRRVLVTRPAQQAAAWVERLRAHGVAAEALPLLEIAAADDSAPVIAAWRALPATQLVVFVSANAVEHFFALRPAGVAWPAATAAAAPGPGTVDALRAAGVDDRAIARPGSDAAQLDSEALWEQLRARDWAGARVLVVRGGSGRDWLAERLREAGARVDAVAAYRRVAPPFDRDGRARAALDAALTDADAVWLFSSSEAIDHLDAATAAAPPRWASARAIATHPRIAARARALGFGTVVDAAPHIDAVVACIQSMQP